VHGFAATFVSACGPFGLIFPAIFCALVIAAALGRRVFRNATLCRQVLGGCTFTLALFTGGMELALHTGLVTREWLLTGLALTTIAAALWARDVRPTSLRAMSWGAVRREWSALPMVLLALAGLLLASLSAYWLPVWQWDALGYHLPFVNFVLQGGGLAELPPDVPYLSTYPRNVELLFVALRALLPDDRLVDIGQLPFGVVAAGAVFGIARELGAAVTDAVVAAASWLLLPAVFLQLPTNYIDVAGAAYYLLASYFLLSKPSGPTLLAAGAALGQILGTKPSVPPAALLLGCVLLWRGRRAGLFGVAAGSVALAGALGLEAYVVQWWRHGNPVWPATVHLGPLHLPGTISVEELLASGINAQKVHGPMWLRVLRSWSSFDSLPTFDMRVGGFSPVFWVALPAALVMASRRESRLAFALLAVALVTPDPAVARYVLGFPGLVLALAAALVSGAPSLTRRFSHGALALLGIANLSYAAPGLTGEGPPLLAYAGMTWPQRRVAVGAQGRPTEIVRAIDKLGSGDVAVFDAALALPYSMWRSDMRNRVERVRDGATIAEAERVVASPAVRLVAAGRDRPAARAAAALPSHFIWLFSAPEQCEVYGRR
jgi:hypothetical protein